MSQFMSAPTGLSPGSHTFVMNWIRSRIIMDKEMVVGGVGDVLWFR